MQFYIFFGNIPFTVEEVQHAHMSAYGLYGEAFSGELVENLRAN